MSNGNGHDWDAIRKAFEAGEPWKKLQTMGPHKSTVARRASKEGWDSSKRNGNGNGHLKIVRDSETAQQGKNGATGKGRVAEGHKPGQPHSNKAKAEALLIYIEKGSAILTAEETGIPSGTIRRWICEDPTWANAREQASQAIRDILNTESRAIIERHVGLLLNEFDAQRLNAANSIIKNITQTVALLAGDPTERTEHVTKQEAQQSLSRQLGLGAVMSTGDAETVSTEIPSGSLPS
jgi:hypothetical protein